MSSFAIKEHRMFEIHPTSAPQNTSGERFDRQRLEGVLASTLSMLARVGEIDRELLGFAPQALELAAALVPDEEIAFQITLDAAIQVKRLAQKKEHYRRSYQAGKATKVLPNRAQLFQYLIWCEAQKWERFQENDYLLHWLHTCDAEIQAHWQPSQPITESKLKRELECSEISCDPHLAKLSANLHRLPLTESDLAARYIELLIQDAVEGNASQVALVVSHLIYDYPLSFVTELCSLLSPNALGGQYFYTLKAKFQNRIKERFGAFLVPEPKSETLSPPAPAPEQPLLERVVQNWLRRLTPWATGCLTGAAGTTGHRYAERLYDWLEQLNNPDQKEMSCAHLVICPDCYGGLARATGPRKRAEGTESAEELADLSVPRFHIPKSQGRPPMSHPSNHRPVLKSGTDFQELAIAFVARADRPGSDVGAQTTWLVFADGQKTGEIRPARTGTLSFTVPAQTKLIKVVAVTPEGLIPIASCVPAFRQKIRSWSERLWGNASYSVQLEEGAAIQFQFDEPETEPETSPLTVTLSYHPSSLWQRTRQAVRQVSFHLPQPSLLVPVGVTALVLMMCGWLAFHTFQTRLTPANPVVKKEGVPPVPNQKSVPIAEPKPAPTVPLPKEEAVAKQPVPKKSAPVMTAVTPEDDQMLSPGTNSVADLSQVEAIVIALPANPTSQDEELAPALAEALAQYDFTIVTEKNQADALLKWLVENHDGNRFWVFQLINSKGELLARKRVSTNETPAEIARRLATTLADEKKAKTPPEPNQN
ncbi:MAG: hypothetical protein K1Y36_12945 [Blastocatellia bacterium]|nr:hypothetical protein [Blastocatellia bacterium]